jgi:alpha-1,2-mannosyltransferase
VSGNLSTPGDVASAPGRQTRNGGSADADGVRGKWQQSAFGGSRLRAYWLSDPGKVMLIATVLALAIRLFTLTRSGFLTGVTEYDDGVYIGGSIRMTEGQLPYLNFAFVQPPGILELMLPVALLAKVFSTVKALALARLLTALASTACIPLVGNLVRYRGAVVTAVACGVLAVYPPDISTAHTLLLEPWMNLFCLIAINLAFRRGHLARPAMLGWSGVALGFAGAIKFWAAAPALVLLVLCILLKTDRGRRVRNYVLGLVVGFVVPTAPFLVTAPVTFIRSTIFDQAAREGSAVAFGVKMANLTGLIDVYTDSGRLMLNAGAHSMFSAGEEAGIGDSHSLGWLPLLAAFVLIVALVVGYARQGRRLTPLEWLSLATAVIATVAVTAYSAFFYHYADFPAPWLALALGGAAGALAGHRRWSMVAIRVFAVLIVLVTVLQIREMYPLRRSGAQALAAQIPASACVITDMASLTVAADRFANLPAGCPDIIDSLAATLVLSNGVSVQGGAQDMPPVVAQWKTWLGKADYVLLSPGHASQRRIPWTAGLWSWFKTEFVADGKYSPATGQLYQRVDYSPPAGFTPPAS